MTGEGAEIGILTFDFRRGDVDHKLGLRIGHVGVGDDIVGVGDVVLLHALRIRDHEIALLTEALQGARFGEEPVMGDNVGVLEHEGEFLTCFGLELFLHVLQAQCGFDDQFASTFAVGPGVGLGWFGGFKANLSGVVCFGDFGVAGEIGEWLGQSMGGQENVMSCAHSDMNLAGGDDLRDLDEERLAAIELLHAADLERIVAGRVGILHRIFRRAVLRPVFVVPALREARRGIRVLHGLVEAEEHAVVACFKTHRHGFIAAGEAHALEAAVLRCVTAPALHAIHIKMPVLRVEAGALRAGVEVPADFDRRRLPATFDVLPHHEPGATAT